MTQLQIFPAIDIKDGRCVRLRRGELNQRTLYPLDPVSQALVWREAGFDYLHVVDLDGAFEGTTTNFAVIQSLIRSVNIPIQLGGGIRKLETLVNWLSLGVDRIILGSATVGDFAFVRRACVDFPMRIAAAVDARDGLVATNGWNVSTEVSAVDLARRLEDIGIATIIYTDISRDGMMSGPNLRALDELSRHTRLPIIASGGISNRRDIVDLRKIAANTNVAGAIVGRAMYDRVMNPSDVFEALVD